MRAVTFSTSSLLPPLLGHPLSTSITGTSHPRSGCLHLPGCLPSITLGTEPAPASRPGGLQPAHSDHSPRPAPTPAGLGTPLRAAPQTARPALRPCCPPCLEHPFPRSSGTSSSSTQLKRSRPWPPPCPHASHQSPPTVITLISVLI